MAEIHQIAPYDPTLRTLTMCDPTFNGINIEYRSRYDDMAVHLKGGSHASVKSSKKAILGSEMCWIEMVHYPHQGHDQITITLWDPDTMLLDIAMPTRIGLTEVLQEHGTPPEVVELAITAAFDEDHNVILYQTIMEANDTWAYYIVA